LSRLPLLNGLLDYVNENNISFSMPGHRNGEGFIRTDEGKQLYENIIKMDITEVEGLDNLHKAEGIIKESLNLLQNYYGSKKAYFLVNGSTSGNLAMIFSCFNEGDKIIVERNCHRSIMNGIIIRKLKPVYINNRINKKYNAPLSIDEECFFNIIKDNSDAKGIIITYPNYYGICLNLKKIIKEAHKADMYVLVDSAHGAHFGACEELPQSAVKCGADMVVMSSHKTLPSFTQTAYLHINNCSLIEKSDFYISVFTSTSPSYMFMCSMEYARYYLEYFGRQDYKKLINLANTYRKKINMINGINILSMEDLEKNVYDMDKSRYIINVKQGYSAEGVMNYLRKSGIQCEMNDTNNIILILSPFNKESDFNLLYKKLKGCNLEDYKENEIILIDIDTPSIELWPYEVIERKKISIELNKAEGNIAAESIVPYPPGVPIIMPGETISKNIIKMIQYYLKNDKSILGVIKNKDKYFINIVLA
jgi:arginine/lysine/ornithine decarboxylase